MKKWMCALLAVMLVVGLTACGEKRQEQEQPNTEPVPEVTEAPVQMEETTIFDDDNCSFTIVGAEENAYTGLELEVVCENKTERILMFTWSNSSVCGYMYDPFWAEEVQPGEKVTSTIYLDTFALEEMGITSVDEITFDLYVYDSEDFMAEPLVNQTFTVYPTGLDADRVSYPERKALEEETVIVDNEVMTFVIEKLYTMEKLGEDDGEAYRIHCYILNKTDKNLMVAWEGISIDGTPVNTYWATVVAASKQAYSDVVFYHLELENAGITELGEINFSLTASDYDDWYADFLLEEDVTYKP